MTLRTAIEAQLFAIESLEALLLQERAMLITPDANGIVDLLAHKDDALAEVSRCAQDLGRELAASGLPADAQAIERHFALTPEIQDNWRRLRSTMDRTRSTNAANGRLISQRLQATTARLDALRGAAMRTGVYNPSGRSGDSQNSSRMIASA